MSASEAFRLLQENIDSDKAYIAKLEDEIRTANSGRDLWRSEWEQITETARVLEKQLAETAHQLGHALNVNKTLHDKIADLRRTIANNDKELNDYRMTMPWDREGY